MFVEGKLGFNRFYAVDPPFQMRPARIKMITCHGASRNCSGIFLASAGAHPPSPLAHPSFEQARVLSEVVVPGTCGALLNPTRKHGVHARVECAWTRSATSLSARAPPNSRVTKMRNNLWLGLQMLFF